MTPLRLNLVVRLGALVAELRREAEEHDPDPWSAGVRSAAGRLEALLKASPPAALHGRRAACARLPARGWHRLAIAVGATWAHLVPGDAKRGGLVRLSTLRGLEHKGAINAVEEHADICWRLV